MPATTTATFMEKGESCRVGEGRRSASLLPVLAAAAGPERARMARWVAEDGWTAELACDNPALFFLLARAAQEARLAPAEVKSLVRLRRRDLLAALGCDPSSSTERFLKRVSFDRLCVDEELALRALVERPLPAWARHWQRPHLALLTRMRPVRWPYAAGALDSLLANERCLQGRGGESRMPEEMRGAWGAPLVRRAIEEIAEVVRLIEYGRHDIAAPTAPREAAQLACFRQLAGCRSLQALEALHQQVIDQEGSEWLNGIRRQMGDRKWPPAPLAGNENILPVDTPEMLAEEGAVMRHCIATYAERVLAGRGYVYRVLAPERATVYLVKDATDHWRLQEMRLSCNRVPSDETRGAVLAWAGVPDKERR